MTFLFITIAIAVGSVLGLLLWSTRHRSTAAQEGMDQLSEQTLTCRHVANLQQLRQIFESADLTYLNKRVDRSVLRSVRKVRHRVATKFLAGLREDFLRLEEVSSIVAALSVEVDAREEWRRFRLAAEFRLKFAVLRTKYALGLATSDSFRNLAWMVSSLAVKLERAINEIAAGAALAQRQRPSSQS